MLTSLFGQAGAALDPARRGYHMLYRCGEVNRCPGCGRSHWYVGRLSAECGFCGTALALAESGLSGTGSVRKGRRGGRAFADAA